MLGTIRSLFSSSWRPNLTPFELITVLISFCAFLLSVPGLFIASSSRNIANDANRISLQSSEYAKKANELSNQSVAASMRANEIALEANRIARRAIAGNEEQLNFDCESIERARFTTFQYTNKTPTLFLSVAWKVALTNNSSLPINILRLNYGILDTEQYEIYQDIQMGFYNDKFGSDYLGGEKHHIMIDPGKTKTFALYQDVPMKDWLQYYKSILSGLHLSEAKRLRLKNTFRPLGNFLSGITMPISATTTKSKTLVGTCTLSEAN